MGKDLSHAECVALEKLIDTCGLPAVLEALSNICGEKAEHIRASYNDAATARVWDTACGAIGCFSTTKEIHATEGKS